MAEQQKSNRYTWIVVSAGLVALLAVAVAAYRYRGAPIPDTRTWDHTSITAKYGDLSVFGDEHILLGIQYTLTNSSGAPYTLPQKERVLRLDVDGRTTEVGAHWSDFGTVIPAHGSMPYKLILPQDAVDDGRKDPRGQMPERMHTAKGFVLLDPASQRAIELPAGWPVHP